MDRFFIVNIDDINIDIILSFCVQDKITARRNNDNTKLVVKLCDGDEKEHPELSQYTEYNLNGILEKMQGDEWVKDDF